MINSVRKQNGLAPVQWTQAVQQAVQKSAELRAAAGVGMVHTNALGNNDTQNFYNSLGLYLTSENLGQSIGTDLTMLGAKIAILNSITAMVYQDGAHGDGHLRNFLQPNLMMGFALQQYPDYYVLVFQGAQAMADSAPQVELALNATNQILEARGGDTPANRAALAAAQQALATLKANNAAAMNALKAANAQKITDIQNDTAKNIQAIEAGAVSQNAEDNVAVAARLFAYSQITINNYSKQLAITLDNQDNRELTVMRVQVSDGSVYSTNYSNTDLSRSGIPTLIAKGQSFGITISSRFGWDTTNLKVIVTVETDTGKTQDFSYTIAP